ncbi:hypothetical protein [uncultured Ruminococcus sp.]|uniref:hypothetical protein n=1 Tax=uncultured Ruminococcus sp. TaxID=165186 RepID=UPI0025EE4710|nr:hypothetical protein [uncultured Ruminococcus sp.]
MKKIISLITALSLSVCCAAPAFADAGFTEDEIPESIYDYEQGWTITKNSSCTSELTGHATIV